MKPPTDEFSRKFLARIPPEIGETFDERQLTAVKMAFGGRSFGQHTIEIRRSIPLLWRRIYLVLLIGREERTPERLATEKRLRPLWTLPNLGIIGLFLIILIGSIFSGVYTADQTLNFGLFPDGKETNGPSQWRQIGNNESVIAIDPGLAKIVTRIESREFGDSSREELMFLQSESDVIQSQIYTKTAGTGRLFVAESSGRDAAIDELRTAGPTKFKGADKVDVGVSKADENIILYLEAAYPANVKCFYATKRLGETEAGKAESGRRYFKSLVEFQYCSSSPASDILTIFNEISPRVTN